ncbi:MAG: hypothetical protein HKN39_06840 [Flavobacteriales bacterium]|nr:hypothetical protein [Flavobacteriales bacterium]
MKSFLKTLFTVSLCVLSLSGCKKDFEDLASEQWKPILAIPLVNSLLTVDDILNEFNHPEEVIILPGDLVALNYKGELFSFQPSEVLVIGDSYINETLTIDNTLANELDNSSAPLELPFLLELPMELDPIEISISEVKIANGSLESVLTRLQDEFISGELSINELLDQNEDPLSISFNGDEPIGQEEIQSIDLAGYTLLPFLAPPFEHKISLSGTLSLSNNSMNTATSGELLEISLALSDLVFEHIIGDFGNIKISQDTDTIELNLFDNIQGGLFSLDEVILNLNVINSFGMPFVIELDEVESINQNTGVVTQLFLSDLELEGQEILGGPAEEVLFTFNDQNANLTSLIDPAPIDVIFDINAFTNPDGPPPPEDLNFISDQSAFHVDIDLILPLEGYALDFLLTDTIDMDLSFDQYEEIDSLEFKLFTENGFPMEIEFQAIFLDGTLTPLDSLFMISTPIIAAAEIDINGNVIQAMNETTYISFDNERADALEQADHILLRAIFNTTSSNEPEVVRITDAQDLSVQIGVKIFGELEL